MTALGGVQISLNLHDLMLPTMHGRSRKDMVVLHETVSPQIKGLGDISGVAHYLHTVGYGIHGMTDNDGNIGWSFGLGTGIFWQAAGGNTNQRSIGIEQVSNVPSVVVQGKFSADSIKLATSMWAAMEVELRTTATLLAAIHKVHGIALTTSDGKQPGVTTHYLVTKAYGIVGGHWDCWPVNDGGYYPLSHVLSMARDIAAGGT